MRTLFLLLITYLSYSPVTWAQDTVRGNMHAVINADGTISYYLKTSPDKKLLDVTTNIKKHEVQKFISGKTPPRAFKIVSGDQLAGYYIASQNHEDVEPVAMAVDSGYEAKAVSYDSLPESYYQVYKLKDRKGKIGGAWLPSNDEHGVSALGALIPIDWSTSKLRASSDMMQISSSDIVPIPEDDLIASLRESMLQQAISLACQSRVVPKEIAVAASVAASVGFIVGGEGTISFQATWETSQLCKT